MLKIALSEEEYQGARLMIWWHGEGAARVLAHDNRALLLERALDCESLAAMVRAGMDDEASRIICSVASTLHAHKGNPPSSLLSLRTWFAGLENAALKYGGMFTRASQISRELLDSPRDMVVLHGDLHHGNILNFGERGWLAIDPKHVSGERGFDFANIFCNPDQDMALKPGRLMQQVSVVAESAQLEHHRLLQWILAYAGLSAAWSLEDGDSTELALAVADIVSSVLGI